MAIKAEDIQKLASLLVSNIPFKLDYKKYLNDERKLLVVEGTTDECFVKNIKNENVDCVTASKVFSSNAALSTGPKSRVNSKEAIYSLIVGISNYPSNIIRYPSDIDKWDIYGLIDRDDEDCDPPRPLARLLVTDTHDLETLMMSTDKEILQRLDGCGITQEDIDKAHYLAYQLSESRAILKKYYDPESFDIRVISTGSYSVIFSEITDKDRINIHKLINYVIERSEDPIPEGRRQGFCDSVCEDKKIRRNYDPDGCWKAGPSEFNGSVPADFWLKTNGHDILQLLMYINEDVHYKFSDPSWPGLNRLFEMKLIEMYDYSAFEKTELNKKMVQSGLISC